MTALLRLYPQAWRERYGEEFLALLESRPPDGLDRIDIVRGAVDAHLHPQRRADGGSPEPEWSPASPTDRVIGALTMLGAALIVAVVIVVSIAPEISDGGSTYRDGAAAYPLLIGALALLAVGVVRTAGRLPSAAEGGRGGAALTAVFGPLWSLVPWVVVFWGLASVGLIALAVSAYRNRVWSPLEAGLVVGGLAVSWTFALVGLSGLVALGPLAWVGMFLAVAMVWLGVGRGLRRPSRRTGLAEPAPAGGSGTD